MLPQRQRARSPSAGAHRPTPVRNHRRSKSAGEKWLDHRPEAIAPLETVLQPKMKHKKSVGKLEVKDTNKASRYILTTQDSDTQGNLQTKLVKGDVKPTATGGSAVVFTGVETLKQTSPGDRAFLSPLSCSRRGDNTWQKAGKTMMANGQIQRRGAMSQLKDMAYIDVSATSIRMRGSRLYTPPSTRGSPEAKY
ncbi:KIF23 [Bugula neritina]|uniref:KIF23 n=1 Tax=Bugula neritina TaxID=10212 RepID=A0A7J7KRV8_BUGNE|nr:KIF23 [Bugula neritina]